jgi:hypothetical protein
MKRIFFPAFLERYDRYLLLNKPGRWSIRLHRIAWIVILSAIILKAYFLLQPNDARTESTVYTPTILVTVMCIIGFIFWMIYLLRFNVFKRFGPTGPWSFMAGFLQIFGCIGLLTVLPFIPSGIESFRANQQFESEEIVKDVNRMNQLIGHLMTDSLQKDWSRDTVILNPGKVFAYSKDTSSLEQTIDGVNYATLKGIAWRKETADSTEMMGDTGFVFLTPPDYNFIQASGAEEYSQSKPYTAKQLYFLVQNTRLTKTHAELQKEYETLRIKYANPEQFNDYYAYEMGSENVFLNILKTTSISSGIDNITSRKYSWYGYKIAIFFRVWFYITLFMSLLVFAFRHSSVKVFFIGLLSAFILAILTSVGISFSNLSGSSTLRILIMYILVFAGISARLYNSKTQERIHGIALNLFLISIFFLPLLFAAQYFQHLGEMDLMQSDYELSEAHRQFRALVYVLCEFGGFALLLIALPTYFYKAYRKWMALPEI